jgi:hypothetical protein
MCYKFTKNLKNETLCSCPFKKSDFLGIFKNVLTGFYCIKLYIAEA